jgi:DNA-directed RNA polymerase specialized sigma24 family protein
MATRVLSEGQKRLVADNLGLVATHLRRRVRGMGPPTRQREWDDLFQEGCLGLAAAAGSFEESSGIPFAAYALRRIQSAVHRALQTAFETVHVPDAERHRPDRESEPIRRVVSMDCDPTTRAVGRRTDPFADPGTQTVGTRMHGRYARALRGAAEEVVAAGGKRRRDDGLAGRLVEERLLIARDDVRVPLRQIARDTGSSYARVAYTEKRLLDAVRSRLVDDPEMSFLRSESRRSVEGVESPLDAGATNRLQDVLADGFMEVFESASPGDRGMMLVSVLEELGVDVRSAVRMLLGRLSWEATSELLDATAERVGC